ncbi:MAG: hypothetical protein GY938_28550 [Ketobacter sp.]|nr:hypothetical protein [Ketobacter sp.]
MRKKSHSMPIFQLLLTPLLGSLFLWVALFLLTEPMPEAKAAASSAFITNQAAMPVTFVLDDFNDAKYAPDLTTTTPRNPNNFFANQGIYETGGALITDTLACISTFSCYLIVAYDVSAGSAAEGGYVEELGYAYTYNGGDPSTWALRDMSSCQALQFSARGDPGTSFTSQFEIEFIGQNWGVREQKLIPGVTTSWQTFSVPLAQLTTVDPAQLKQIAVRLPNQTVSQPVGALHFDDFAFIGCQFNGSLLDLIERQTFYYFWETRHPTSGFVRDRAVDPFYNRNVTSVAAIGFELTSFGIGAERGWVSRTAAASATLQVLDKLVEISPTASNKGFYYHLLKIDTGTRDGNTELSTIDTALLMAGVLFVREYFTDVGAVETAIRQQADLLFNTVDWNWALRTEVNPANTYNQFYLAWKPAMETGFEIPAPDGGYFAGTLADPTTWEYYTDEILLINIMALGSPTHAVITDTFTAWTREQGSYGGYTLYQSWFGQLFANFIGQGWLDLRCVKEHATGINWWQNSGQAALANRQFAIDQALTYTTYATNSWGLSPSLGPPPAPYSSTMAGVGVYSTYAGLPKGEIIPANPLHDGTIAPYAAAGSIVFLSSNPAENEAYLALDYWYQNQPALWGIYGFVDSFNLGKQVDTSDDWYAHDYIGIDQGMTLLALENYQTSFVWSVMNKSSVIQAGKTAVFGPGCYTYLPIVQKNS